MQKPEREGLERSIDKTPIWPISFVPQLIRAILQNRKTQTRRLIRPQPQRVHTLLGGEPIVYIDNTPTGCRLGHAGNRLWVQEQWAPNLETAALFDAAQANVVYAADLTLPLKGGWKPARFMPRRNSRLTLQIDSLRVERVQDISIADARAEGFDPDSDGADPREWFRRLWDELSDGTSDWKANPWVWVIGFHRVV